MARDEVFRLLPRQQAALDETKKMAALSACLRRVCTPKPMSGKLEVSQEIHRQWANGGSQRKALLNILAQCNGDKAGGDVLKRIQTHSYVQ